MDFNTTLAWFAVVAAVGVYCGWAGARLPDPKRGARLLPYRFLMMLAATAALFLLVHLVNLAGVRTGPG